MPVLPDIIGVPEKGYYVRSVEVQPKDVVIEGAKSEVRRIGILRTEQIDLAGLTEDFNQELTPKFSNGSIRSKPGKVEVHVRIARRGK